MIGKISVSTDALRENAKALSALIAPAKAAFVVKANGYGHGAVETALAIEPLAHRICVYAAEEGLELREGGITAPILVMGPVPQRLLREAHLRKLEIALWDTGSYLRALAAAAHVQHGAFPVHVKINTGVARLGLEIRDAADALEDFARLGELSVAGIFSHLASAEELDSPFTLGQLERFERVLASTQPLFANKRVQPLRHIAASAAAMLWPQTRLDMVRFGIALYGLWPSPQTQGAMRESELRLRPALSYTSELVVIRQVEAGTPIGYGGSYRAPRSTRIGIVPLGYAKGIPRALSNRGFFLVRGARCPIVGRVCMNMTMIDLAASPAAAVGDEVTLIGTNGAAQVSADDWASWSETINYEIVTRLPPTIPREYV